MPAWVTNSRRGAKLSRYLRSRLSHDLCHHNPGRLSHPNTSLATPYFKIADPLKGTAMWIAVHDATVVNGTNYVTNTISGQSRFYRLMRP